MTLEIILFTLAILVGVLVSFRESKNNRIYRFFNSLFNSKELQMKADNRKGFVYKQSFIIRLIWIVVGYLILTGVLWFVTPINSIYIQHFASVVVGTLIGTYLTKLFFTTTENLSTENVLKHAKETFEKGKDFVEEITETETKEQAIEETNTPEPESIPEPKKSARERLRDKGMIK